MRLSARRRESANCAARSVTLKRGGGQKALVGEQGETEREGLRVPVEAMEVRVGEMGAASKVKLESNMLGICRVRFPGWVVDAEGGGWMWRCVGVVYMDILQGGALYDFEVWSNDRSPSASSE